MQEVRIYIIGVPLSLYEGLNPDAKEILKKAEKIFCSPRFLEAFKRQDFLKNKMVSFPEKLSEIKELLAKERGDVAVLATGDPNFFGISSFLINNLGNKVVKIIPSVSTMQEAFARLKLSWDDASFFSVHGKSRDGLLTFFLKHKKGFLFTSNSSDVLYALKILKDYRLDDYRVYLLENLGMENERLTILTFPYLLKNPLSNLNVLVFERDNAFKDYIGIGIPDDDYEKKKGMITKREIRANALSLLSLREGNVLWDIGAGSGSISIEASYNPKGVISYAIENDEESFLNLKKNIKKFSAINVKPLYARFLEVYKDLPLPDRVFLGGGGPDWIINFKKAYEYLKEKGVMVVSMVLTGHLAEAISFCEDKNISYDLISLSCSYRDDKTKILKSKNPVFLMKIEKR